MIPLNSTSIALLFPGQGSQSIGMGRELAQAYPSAGEIFAKADELLGIPLSSLAWEGPEEELNDTINTQPALLVHSFAVLSILQQKFPALKPAFVAGHSMGELSALIASGSLSYEAALRLARRRGELMKEAGVASPGGMAAVLGADIPSLEQFCSEASTPDSIVQVANDNCPGQVVISGSSQALERAVDLAQRAGVRKIRPLAVSIAAHSPLMTLSQERFSQAVEEAGIVDPLVPLVGNVSALPLSTAAEIKADLRLQLTSRVRWTESIQEMVQRGITTFLELGNGSVLTGLLKRIDPDVKGISLGKPDDFEKLISSTSS